MDETKRKKRRDESKFTEQIQLRLSSEMKADMEKLARRRGYSYSSTIYRDAVEAFIEHEGDEIGSRRFFNKSMRDRLDELEERLSFIMLMGVKSNVAGFSYLLQSLNAPAPQGSSWEEGPYYSRLLQSTFRDYNSMEAATEKLLEKIREAKQKALAEQNSSQA